MGIPPEWPMAEILKYASAAQKGRPVPWVKRYVDGRPAEVVYHPLPSPAKNPAPRKRGGRPEHPLTKNPQLLADHIHDNPGLSARDHARLFEIKLKVKTSPELIRKIRRLKNY
jgi:hypothetical protein